MFLRRLVTLISLFIAVAANAQNSNSYRVLGRGIQQKETKEIVLLACVENMSTKISPDCGILRPLLLRPSMEPVWLGGEFVASETEKMQAELGRYYSNQFGALAFSSLKDGTSALSDQNGWNWSNDPLNLPASKYERVISSILLYSAYHHESVLLQKKWEAAQTPAVAPLTIEQKQISLQQCSDIAKKQIGGVNSDKIMLNCLEKNGTSLSLDGCIQYSKSLSTTEATDQGLNYCLVHLDDNVSFVGIKKIAYAFENKYQDKSNSIIEKFLNQRLNLKALTLEDCLTYTKELYGNAQKRGWAACYHRFIKTMNTDQAIRFANTTKKWVTNFEDAIFFSDLIHSSYQSVHGSNNYLNEKSNTMHDEILQAYFDLYSSQLTTQQCFDFSEKIEDRIQRKKDLEKCTHNQNVAITTSDVTIAKTSFDSCIEATDQETNINTRDHKLWACIENHYSEVKSPNVKGSFEQCIAAAKKFSLESYTTEALRVLCLEHAPTTLTNTQIENFALAGETDPDTKYSREYYEYNFFIEKMYEKNLKQNQKPSVDQYQFFIEEMNGSQKTQSDVQTKMFSQYMDSFTPEQCIEISLKTKTWKQETWKYVGLKNYQDIFLKKCVDGMKKRVSAEQCKFIANYIENRTDRATAIKACEQ